MSFIKFHLAKDVKLSALGRHPKVIILFYVVFVFSFYQCTDIIEGTHYATSNTRDKFQGHASTRQNEFFETFLLLT